MAKDSKMKVVIVSGMSGAGKTHAADWLEDHGYYCIDNMPPALITNFMGLASYKTNQLTKAAFVVDIRSDEFFSSLNEAIELLKARDDVDFSILFVDASDSTLIRRFNETRRNHPLTEGRTDKDVIERERDLLASLKSRANHVLDTTNMKVTDFNREMEMIYGEEPVKGKAFSINVLSFGYKYGVPQETDMVFDARFIPNPYYVDSLRKLTGNNKKVQNYVLGFPIARTFVDQLEEMIDAIAPCFIKEGKNHLNIAFGCTGGQHRSVTLANEMAARFRDKGYRVTLEHREL